jgi:3-oxoacyl-[acyl-carrier-protein] synthase II
MSPRGGAQEVVITGVGAVTPLGSGARALHRRWCEGHVAIRDGCGRCEDFQPQRALSRREIRIADRFTQFALVAAAEALGEAGWLPVAPYEAERIACVVATGVGGIQTCLAQHDRIRELGPGQVSPLTAVMQMPNAAAAMIAQRHGFHGECKAVVSACAGGTQVFLEALRLLADPNVDAVLAGGADAAITPQAQAAFARMGALSPSGVARPFDRRRDGFVMGEGAGILVLERAAAARARGARALGRVLGAAATTDAYHLSAPEPSGRLAALAIERALQAAGVAAHELDYVNSHGTASRQNDVAETRAIKLALGSTAARVPVSSTKSAIGHLMGAAGSVEAIATLLALRDRIAPPTLGLNEPDEGLDLDYVAQGPRPLRAHPDGEPYVAISNSFGLGGHNAVVVLSAP